MIRVQKPATPPVILTTEGVAECAILCAEYDFTPTEFPENRFKRTIYAHTDVQGNLINAQHGKCCFCERRVDWAGEVEHYRPKAAMQRARRQSLQRPGYYWLAYSWDNLLLCCHECNTHHKRSLFPLRVETNRARSHNQDIGLEDPLLINPTLHDPEQHITWRGSVPIGRDDYGRETISILRLDDQQKRSDLFVSRRQRLAEVHRMVQLLRLAPQLDTSQEGKSLLADARQFLAEAERSDDTPFAAMVRAALQSDFRDAVAADGSMR